MILTYHCPRCGLLLQSSGVVTIDAGTPRAESLPVFQCGQCEDTAELFGVSVPVAFTFAVNAAGQPVTIDGAIGGADDSIG